MGLIWDSLNGWLMVSMNSVGRKACYELIIRDLRQFPKPKFFLSSERKLTARTLNNIVLRSIISASAKMNWRVNIITS